MLNFGTVNRSSGLGLSTALLLLSQNASVSLLDINPPPSSLSESSLLSNPSRTLFSRTDVTKSTDIQSAVDATIRWITQETHAPLGGVIACAGIGYGERILPRQDIPASTGDGKEQTAKERSVKTMSMEAFDRVIAINLRGTVDLVRLVVPHLAAVEGQGDDEERGVVVLVSSVAAYEGQVGQAAYSASKAGVAGIVLPLARELGKAAGIRVVGIAPGVFETGMTKRPRKAPYSTSDRDGKKRSGIAQSAGTNSGMVEYPTRMGRPEEFATFVLGCLQNGMANGSVFRLDGALRMPSRL